MAIVTAPPGIRHFSISLSSEVSKSADRVAPGGTAAAAAASTKNAAKVWVVIGPFTPEVTAMERFQPQRWLRIFGIAAGTVIAARFFVDQIYAGPLKPVVLTAQLAS
jgi:hypothetical protein